MEREKKNALSRQRILDAAMREFSAKGYDASSLNTICSENKISKGIIYHHFEGKDHLYLLCVARCFEELTAYLTEASGAITGSTEDYLGTYFNARLHFFVENPMYLGIFADAALSPPAHLLHKITEIRQSFDQLNVDILTKLLTMATLRTGMTVESVVEDFRMYMDYFNMRFKVALAENSSPEQALRHHEERCHHQMNILLYGVLVNNDEKR